MDLDRDRLQRDIHALYAREHAELGTRGTAEHLTRGRDLAERHDLSGVLTDGGVLVFPHAGVLDCGYQIAACVHAALDAAAATGRKVLVISVLHAFTPEMERARQEVTAGGDPADWPFWGVQGPGLDGREEWRGDHALISWRHFWEAEVARRGLTGPPEVIERYPYLAGGRPEMLPGAEALAELAEACVIVSTADAFHHGIGYGTPADEAFDHDAEGLARAKAVLEEGVRLLEAGDYAGYDRHCVDAKSDARDAGQLFRHLRGPLAGEVADITFSDAAALYGAPPPTWVAAALFVWRRAVGAS
jgi:hypothetical protein